MSRSPASSSARRDTTAMPSQPEPSQKYHAAITLLAESAERDGAKDVAAVLEGIASAISLGLLPEFAAACMKFWAERAPGGADHPRPK